MPYRRHRTPSESSRPSQVHTVTVAVWELFLLVAYFMSKQSASCSHDRGALLQLQSTDILNFLHVKKLLINSFYVAIIVLPVDINNGFMKCKCFKPVSEMRCIVLHFCNSF